MAWIKQVSYADSRGVLRQAFDEALERAGRIWSIVRIMSIRPHTLQSSMRMYAQIMMTSSELSRVQREMLAMVVSSELRCEY